MNGDAGGSYGGHVVEMRMLSGKAQQQQAKHLANLESREIGPEEKAEIQARRAAALKCKREASEEADRGARASEELQARLAQRQAAAEAQEGSVADAAPQSGSAATSEVSGELQALLARRQRRSGSPADARGTDMQQDSSGTTPRSQLSAIPEGSTARAGASEELQVKLARRHAQAGAEAAASEPSEAPRSGASRSPSRSPARPPLRSVRSSPARGAAATEGAAGAGGELQARLARRQRAADAAEAVDVCMQDDASVEVPQRTAKRPRSPVPAAPDARRGSSSSAELQALLARRRERSSDTDDVQGVPPQCDADAGNAGTPRATARGRSPGSPGAGAELQALLARRFQKSGDEDAEMQ